MISCCRMSKYLTMKTKEQRRAYEQTPRRLAARFFRQYGITREQRERVYADQNGCCAICKKSFPSKQLHTDHDHSTGRGINGYGGAFRGLLCVKCNHGLGMFDDDPQRLMVAIAYLTKSLISITKPEPMPKFCESKKPCKHCGGTQRYRSNRNCVPCFIKKERQRRENKRLANASHEIRILNSEIIDRPGCGALCFGVSL